MKKYIILLFLLYPAFSLYAQSHNASVYVVPVTGTGSKPGDNEFFYNRLNSEVTYQNFKLTKTLKDAEFCLIGTLFPHSNEASEPGRKQYVFHLMLLENKTNENRAEGELVYESPQDLSSLFPVLVHTLLYTIPEDKGKDNWRNKFLYAGGSAFWSPRMYSAETATTYLANFGGGVFAEYHFLDFLSVGTGFEVTTDLIRVNTRATKSYGNLLLEIPVLVKYVFKPGDYFVLEPYAGLHFNIPFLKTSTPSAVSWLAGLQYGVKLGPGVVFIDPRFSMDIGKSALHTAVGAKDIPFQRYIFHLGIGYKLGFFTRD
jgi:hypothetical protein